MVPEVQKYHPTTACSFITIRVRSKAEASEHCHETYILLERKKKINLVNNLCNLMEIVSMPFTFVRFLYADDLHKSLDATDPAIS